MPEQRANNSCAAGQGLRTTLRLPTRQFPSRRRCGREAVCVEWVEFSRRCVMKPTFAVCAALLGLLALSPSAIAEQKTARQCNDDWSANKAAIQASGKTKRVFMAECRGVPLAAPVSVAAPAEKGQYASEAEAKASCPSDAVGSIPHPKSTTPAAAEVTARPGAVGICARRTRLRPVSAHPSPRGALRPDVRASERIFERRDGALAAPSSFWR